MTDEANKLQTVHCLGVTLRLPETWTYEPAPDIEDCWYCYDPSAKSGVLRIRRSQFWHMGDGPLSENAASLTAGLFNKHVEIPLGEEVSTVASGPLCKRTYDEEMDDIRVRHFEYSLFLSEEWESGYENTIVSLEFVLSAALAESPDYCDLIALMDREIRAARLKPDESTPNSDATFNPHNLKTLKCMGVTIRVPEHWSCIPYSVKNGSWHCFNEGEDTGTLWINVARYAMPKGTAAPLPDPTEFTAEMTEAMGETLLDSATEEVDGGKLWKRIFEEVDENDGERLRNVFYSFFLMGNGYFVNANFNLVLLATQVDKPVFRDLIDVMDREIRAAHIAPVSKPAGDELRLVSE